MPDMFSPLTAEGDLDSKLAAYARYKETVKSEMMCDSLGRSLAALKNEEAAGFFAKHGIAEDGHYPEIHAAYQQELQKKSSVTPTSIDASSIQADGRTTTEAPATGMQRGATTSHKKQT